MKSRHERVNISFQFVDDAEASAKKVSMNIENHPGKRYYLIFKLIIILIFKRT